jgi:hypothetical protein
MGQQALVAVNDKTEIERKGGVLQSLLRAHT